MKLPFLSIGVNWKVVKDVHCPLLIDGHWSRVSIFLLANYNTNRMLILDVQFPFLPLGVKWKVVKDVHCPLLLMTQVLTSLSSC